MYLYLRFILKELGYEHLTPIFIYEDTVGSFFMTITDQPTKCTRHLDSKFFVVQDLIKEEHISLESVRTHNNRQDPGRRIPQYSPAALYATEKSKPYYRTTPAYNTAKTKYSTTFSCDPSKTKNEQ